MITQPLTMITFASHNRPDRAERITGPQHLFIFSRVSTPLVFQHRLLNTFKSNHYPAKMYQLYRDHPLLVLSIILANVAVSLWCLYLDPVINLDAVTYLTVAQMFLDSELTAAISYYSWPFYSIFIAAIAKVFMLEVETAAIVLNTLLAISLTLAFVCIVAELSDNKRRVVLIAMAVILLFPSVSKYRSFIIRDFGYLSCYLWSLYFIFRFCATADKKHLLGWLVFAALSSLFRFEGIVFVLIAPYFLFLFSGSAIPHRKKLLTALSVVITVASTALVLWYINDKYMGAVKAAKIAGQDIESLTDLFLANIQARLGGQTVGLFSLGSLLIEDVGIVAYELIRRMAVFYLVFALFAYAKRYVLADPLPRKIWLIYVVTNLLMLIGFSLFNNFLVSRYTMASALTLLILAPFTIDKLINRVADAKPGAKIATWIMLATLVLVSIEGLDVRTRKNFVKSTGQWIDKTLPKEAKIISNDKLLIYYANRDNRAILDKLYSLDTIKLFMNTGEIKNFDYIVLVGTKDHYSEDLMRQTLWFKFGRPVKIVNADKGRYVFIYRTDYNFEQFQYP